MDLVLHLATERFDDYDERWQDQKDDLVAELCQEVGSLRRELLPVWGEKGAVGSLVLALGSAGVFQAASACLRAWLARDRTRRVELSWTVDGREEKVVIEGRAVDDSTFAALADSLRSGLEG
jgi:hypothetical protein